MTIGVNVVQLPARHPDGDDPLRLVEHAIRCVREAAESLTIAARLLAGTGTGAPPPRVAGLASRGRSDRTWLTGQERRVLTLLAAGLSNRQIAQALDISDKTAKNYVHVILSKLNASSRTEAAFTALCERLVDLEECRRVQAAGDAAAADPRTPR
ncbi:LuxR C-terminal-related transcriptional regulator [Actinosynnema sp. NPDC047251]|uniref:LuxR C-terminal-related transcriptional regulator n=1 Tax=Saccharothrix espanaensis TaxID=103731 RepID=UPI0002EB8448|nr:LuxR C-terminal-related transcriptional regulator [Saccharothrix espanaensis]